MRKVDPLTHIDKFTGRLLRENERARSAWEKNDPSAGESARATKLTPEQARKRAIEVARRNQED